MALLAVLAAVAGSGIGRGQGLVEPIDPDALYLFYLHGKIVQDQGPKAVSPTFGPYLYEEILATLRGQGFVVVSEVRAPATNPQDYAGKVARQIRTLRDNRVPAANITVVGASMGAAIAAFVSDELGEDGANTVLLAICHPNMLTVWKSLGLCVYGNVLSIFDASDDLAGTCQPLFDRCSGTLASSREIVLQVGSGHGFLYRPLEEWVTPLVAWARSQAGIERD